MGLNLVDCVDCVDCGHRFHSRNFWTLHLESPSITLCSISQVLACSSMVERALPVQLLYAFLHISLNWESSKRSQVEVLSFNCRRANLRNVQRVTVARVSVETSEIFPVADCFRCDSVVLGGWSFHCFDLLGYFCLESVSGLDIEDRKRTRKVDHRRVDTSEAHRRQCANHSRVTIRCLTCHKTSTWRKFQDFSSEKS